MSKAVFPYVWLFDLDNTLHNANPKIFPQIHEQMRLYIERHLHVDSDEACRIREAYWQRYGATLPGLMHEHGIDPAHFLRETHHFPDLAKAMDFQPALRHRLRQLPGKKILFSNAPRHYATAILNQLGIEPYFAKIHTIEDGKHISKPHPKAFRQLLAKERLNAKNCVMVEDSLDNLVTARQLGMKTVWISRRPQQPASVDLRLNNILDLPNHWRRLLPPQTHRHR